MSAYRHYKNTYLALVVLALLCASAVVTVSIASESDAANANIKLYPNISQGGHVEENGTPKEDVTFQYNMGWNKNKGTFEFSKIPTRYSFYNENEGYYLKGWATNSSSTTVQTSAEVSNKGTYEFWAIWDKCTYTFLPNGGTFTINGSTSQAYYTTTVDDLSIPECVFTIGDKTYSYAKDGFYFAGWSASSSATRSEFEGNELPAPTSKNVNLYAIWKQMVTITYHENQGSVTPNACSFDTYEDQVIPGNEFTYNGVEYVYSGSGLIGYTFLGWSENEDATIPEYTPGVYLKTGVTSIDLYAIWARGCEVIFDPNYETDDPRYSQSIERPVYVPGNIINFEGTTYSYVNPGYSFLGWSTARDSTSPTYVEGNILPASDTGYVLYAVWKPETSKVIFDYGDGYTEEVEVDYGYTFDSSQYMTKHIPAGMTDYKIVGWSTVKMTEMDGNNAYYLPSEADTYSRKITFDKVTSVTLHPIWALDLDASVITLGPEYEGCYYLDNETKGIIVDGGKPHLYIDGVYLDHNDKSDSPFVLKNGAVVNLTVMSDCYFKGADNVRSGEFLIGYAGINVQSGTELIITKDSIGKLTAEGGDVESHSTLGTDKNISGRAGAGIGANGYPSDYDYDSGCGDILVLGGTISAYGGSGAIDWTLYLDEDTRRPITDRWGYFDGEYPNNDIVAAQGIGGTTSGTGITTEINGESVTANIIIAGGTVTAATGHINAYTEHKNNWQVTDSDAKYTDPLYDGTAKTSNGYGSSTVVGPDAIVILTSDSDVIVTSEFDTLYFTRVRDSDGNACTIGSAQSFTVDGTTTIDLGGASIKRGTSLKVPAGKVFSGATITLVTSFDSYFVGTVTATGEHTFNVTLDEPEMAMHGTVNVTVNGQSVGMNEAFGSLSPNQSFTIGDSHSTLDHMIQIFTLTLNAGYKFDTVNGVKIGQPGGGGVIQWRTINASLGESVTVDGNTYVCKLRMELSSEASGTANHVAFTIDRAEVKVTINNTYTEGNISFFSHTFTTGVLKPSELEWASKEIDGVTYDYAVGTQYVYYKDSLNCTINVTTGAKTNPLIVKWITVNDEPVTNYVLNTQSGVYTFVIPDISSETVVEVRYGPTVKISGYITLPSNSNYTTNSQIKVEGTMADGSEGFMPRNVSIMVNGVPQPTREVFVAKGSVAYFKIFSTGTIEEPDGTVKEDWYSSIGQILGISSITVSSEGYRDKNVSPNTENRYALGAVYGDSSINVLLTPVRWDLVFNSIDKDNQGNIVKQTQFSVTVVDGTYYVIPDIDVFKAHELYVKTGYDLVNWHIEKWSENIQEEGSYLGSETRKPGTNMQITCKMVFTTVWSATPHEYDIIYSYYDGLEFDATVTKTSYTVNDGEFTLDPPVRGGYVFDGWLTEEKAEQVVAGEITLEEALVKGVMTVVAGTTGDLHYITVWHGIPVDYILRDTKGIHNDYPTQFVVGSYFVNLPIYANNTKDSTNYTFAGWSFYPSMSGRITDSDRVPYLTPTQDELTGKNVIYVIWVESSLYIINVLNNGLNGGTVTADVYGTPGHPIVLTINADPGYKASKVKINGDIITNPPFEYVTNPYVYEYPTVDEGGVPKPIYYYSIEVIFEKLTDERISYPEYQAKFAYDGSEHIALERGRGYYLVGDYAGTDAGTYTVKAVLEQGFIWMDYSAAEYPISWKITPRTVIIVANSEVKKNSELGEGGWAISDTDYVTYFIVGEDTSLSIRSYVGSTPETSISKITNKGAYENKISVSQSKNSNDEYNYEVIVVHGTYIVYEDKLSSTVIYSITDTSSAVNVSPDDETEPDVTSSNALNTIRLSSNVQSVVRREKE